MSKPEIYISVDVETDGPIPGPNSMLSIGAAAFLEIGPHEATFSANLEQLPDASPDPATMQWWSTQPEAWERSRTDLESAAEAMRRFVAWLEATAQGRKLVFVGYPAGFDFLFVYWYLIRFVGQSPFSFSALDIKTLGMTVLGCGYREVSKRTLEPYGSDRPHPHVAVEDAIEQGELFQNLLRASRAQRRGPAE
jgi:hypothetical protein